MTDLTPATGGPQLPQVRKLLTELPGPKSLELHSRRLAAVSAGVASTFPVYVAAAGGGVIVDVDGNSLIDLGSGIAVTTVGNSAPAVVSGVQEQAGAFTHTCFMITPYEGYTEVCEQLNLLTPGDHAKKSALFNSGAEAVENAIKVARVATGRAAVVSFEHGYHGRTNLTMGLTHKVMPYKHGFGPFTTDLYRVPASYPYRDGLSGAEAAARTFAALEAQVDPSEVAAMIIEPILGEGGFVVPAPGFLHALAEYCTSHGIVFITDEVQTGFCRTGDWFACDHEGVVPDLITTAKGIAGGMPLAGLTGRAELMDAVHPYGLGGTFGGNPVSCAAALGSIATMREQDLNGRAGELYSIMHDALAKLAQECPQVADIRGRGAMVGVEFIDPATGDPDPALTKQVIERCYRQGVIVLSAGTHSNVLRFLPPLSIPDALLSEAFEILADAVKSLCK